MALLGLHVALPEELHLDDRTQLGNFLIPDREWLAFNQQLADSESIDPSLRTRLVIFREDPLRSNFYELDRTASPDLQTPSVQLIHLRLASLRAPRRFHTLAVWTAVALPPLRAMSIYCAGDIVILADATLLPVHCLPRGNEDIAIFKTRIC